MCNGTDEGRRNIENCGKQLVPEGTDDTQNQYEDGWLNVAF